MTGNNHPNRSRKVQLENAQRALAEWERRALRLGQFTHDVMVTKSLGLATDAHEALREANMLHIQFPPPMTTFQRVQVTASELKRARDTLTSAKVSRDPEAIREAQAEFARCDQTHRDAVHAYKASTTDAPAPLVRS